MLILAPPPGGAFLCGVPFPSCCVGIPNPTPSDETQLKLFLPSTKQGLLNAAVSARDQWTNNPQSPAPTGPAPFFEGGVHATCQSAAGCV
jgi:hypothetical protein